MGSSGRTGGWTSTGGPVEDGRRAYGAGYARRMPQLVLLRHGQSQWNADNLFTGWYDVDLTERGRVRGPGGRPAAGRRPGP